MKCVKYWPDSGKQMFGTTEVNMHDEEIYADCTVRYFSLRNVSRRSKISGTVSCQQSSSEEHISECIKRKRLPSKADNTSERRNMGHKFRLLMPQL